MTELKPSAPSSKLRSHGSAEVSEDLQGYSARQTMMTTTVSRVDKGAKEDSGRSYAWQVAPNLLISFRYAWVGVRYAFQTQRNFRIHTLIGTSAVILGVLLQISAVEMAAIVLTAALVMALELVNTAIESVVDLTVKRTYNELAKIAKDCAAGAVLVAALAALLVASFILLPPLFARFSAWF